MYNIDELKKIYKNKKVLITGHTGFKGAYACIFLKYIGAKVYGYALKEEKNSLYSLIKKEIDNKNNEIKIKNIVDSELYADIRNYDKLKNFIEKVSPDFILHMAAQPLVLKGYEMPIYTYDVNVMGTVNLLEVVNSLYNGNIKKKISILNVTTDKVYENNDDEKNVFNENDKLCGRDPYSNSKSCSELVTYSFKKSFFDNNDNIRISSARAGNVIGGGDISENRIIPDLIKAIKNNEELALRNKFSVRPYQYVLEPLLVYFNILAYQYNNKKYEGNYNIGPDRNMCLDTYSLVKKFLDIWDDMKGKNFSKIKIKTIKTNKKLHEAKFLRLNNSLIKKVFNYKPIFSIDKMIYNTAFTYKDIIDKKNVINNIINVFDKTFGK